MNTIQRQIRGATEAPHAYCIGCDSDYWPASCCAPATHMLIGTDAHEQPYITYSCSQHLSSTGTSTSTRYRSDAEALNAAPQVEQHLRRRTHPNDVAAALARFEKGVQRLRETTA